MSDERAITEALADHFDRACQMWQEEIENTPEEEWRTSDVDFLIPARHLCHVLVSADFYTGDAPMEQYDWNKFFDGDWEGMPPEQLPDKARALEVLAKVRDIVLARLGKINDADLAAKQSHAPWTGETLMHKLLYWLRHHQHHVGELHAELRRRGIPRARWR